MKFNPVSIQRFVLNFFWKHTSLLTYAQSFRYILMRGPLRNAVVRYYQKHSATRSVACSEPSLFPDMEIERIVGELHEKGYAVAFQLPDEYIEKIIEYKRAAGSDNIHHPHKTCAALERIARDRNIIAVARGYIGAEPILYASRLYFTPPKLGPDEDAEEKYKNSKKLHFDVTDFKDLELFIYLTDTDDEASPHIVAEGTHKHKTLRDLFVRRYTKKVGEKRFGERFKTLSGKAGMGFFEDTSAFHIQSIGRKGRLTASISYTLHRPPELARYL